jgi:hypothetical protein
MNYLLTASLPSDSETVQIEAEDDLDAGFSAIKEIMDRAYEERDLHPDQKFWSRGAIELRNASGDVIRTMPSKELTDDN